MMAENKLKHKGEYGNPTHPLDPSSAMKAPRAFDYKKLANADQRGRNTSKYGASPFIVKHFSKAQRTPYVSRAQRLAQGDTEADVPGETDEQKEARLRTTAEKLLEKARELAGLRETKTKAATKIQGLQKSMKIKKFVQGLKTAREAKAAAKAKKLADEAEAEKARKAEARRKREEEERIRNPPKPYQYPKGHPTNFLGEPLSYSEIARAEERAKEAKRLEKERRKSGKMTDDQLAYKKFMKMMGRA